MRGADGQVAQGRFTLGRRLEYQMACQFTSWQMSAKMVGFFCASREPRDYMASRLALALDVT